MREQDVAGAGVDQRPGLGQRAVRAVGLGSAWASAALACAWLLRFRRRRRRGEQRSSGAAGPPQERRRAGAGSLLQLQGLRPRSGSAGRLRGSAPGFRRPGRRSCGRSRSACRRSDFVGLRLASRLLVSAVLRGLLGRAALAVDASCRSSASETTTTIATTAATRASERRGCGRCSCVRFFIGDWSLEARSGAAIVVGEASAASSGGRDLPDGRAQPLGGRGRVGVGGDAARGGDQRRGRAGREGGAEQLRLAALGADAGDAGRSSAASARAGGRCARARWRRRPRPCRSGRPRRAGAGELVDQRRRAARAAAPRGAGRSSTSAAPGLLVRTRAKIAGPGLGRGGDQRLERVAAEQRVGGEGVGAEARRPGPTGVGVSPTSACA